MFTHRSKPRMTLVSRNRPSWRPQRGPAVSPRSNDVVDEGSLNESNRIRAEQDRPCLVGLGLEQAPDEVVDSDVLVSLVRFDMHIVEAAATRGHSHRLQP